MIYKNAMMAYVKSSTNGLVTGSELVQVYLQTAQENDRQISKSHVALNVHKFAKKNAQKVGQCKTKKGQTTSIYLFV
jgi:hypothetical protein